MARLTQSQIEALARSAGMPNPPTMAAIAMAESGGDPNSHNPIPPDNSYGLWQINMLGSLGPARRKEFGLSSNSDLFNPVVNARAAAKILSSQGLSAWSTYTNGAYKKYLSGGTTSASWDLGELKDLLPPPLDWDVPNFGGGESDLIDNPLDGVTDLAKLAVQAGEWMSNPRNWLNVVYVLTGGVIVVATLSATVRNQIIGQAKTLSPLKAGK